MKKFVLIIALIFASAISSSIALPNFWYSGVAYNTLGQIITSPQNVEVSITITDGITVFTETFTGEVSVPTDAFGVFSVKVGTGVNSGNLSSVLMKANTYITVKVRPVGSTTWVTVTGAPLSTYYYNTYVNLEATLPLLPEGQIFIGNADGFAAAQTMSGDATIAVDGVLSLSPIGTAGTYGDATNIPVFTTDSKGRVTAVTNTPIAISPAQLTGGAENDMIQVIEGVPTWTSVTGDVNIFGGNTAIQNSAGNSIVAAINNGATTNRITANRLSNPGTANLVIMTPDATNDPVWGSITAANMSAGDYSSVINTGTYSINISGNAGTVTNGVYTSRTINTIAPLSGGGDLSADRTLSISQANGESDGYLSASDWTTFNNKQDALTFGDVTSTTTGITITGGTGAVIGTGTTIDIALAGAESTGLLSDADWTTFNNKQDVLTAGTGINITSNVVTNTAPDQTVVLTGAGIAEVTGTYPNFTITATEVDGSTTNELNTAVAWNAVTNAVDVTDAGATLSAVIPTAGAESTGLLSSTDWATFNGKQAALTFGDVTSTTTGITITGGTGAVIGTGTTIDIALAGAESTGLLSSTDWATFNGKQAALTAGTGIDLTGNVVTNTAPDQTVVLTGAGIAEVTGTYPNFTITATEVDGSTTNELNTAVAWNAVTNAVEVTDAGATLSAVIPTAGAESTGLLSSTDWATFNGKQAALTAGTGIDLTGNVVTNTAPDQTVVLTGAGIAEVTGTYPNFTITATEVDGSTTNELNTAVAWNVVTNAVDVTDAGATLSAVIPIAGAESTGLLSLTDWATFNGKQAALTAGTGIDLTGNVISSTLGTSIDLTSEVTGTLPVGNGGTNSSTPLNNNRIMVSSSGSIIEAAALTNGQLLIGSTDAAPVAGTITGTTNQVAVTNGAGSITLSLPQDIAASSSPTFGGMTLTGGLTGTSATFTGNIEAQGLITNSSSDAYPTGAVRISDNAGLLVYNPATKATPVFVVRESIIMSTGVAVWSNIQGYDPQGAETYKIGYLDGDLTLGSKNTNTPKAGKLIIRDASVNDYTSTFTAGTQTANIAYTLPTVAPSDGQVLSSDASGVMSWTTPFTSETDPIWTAAISGTQTISGNWTFSNTITGDISGNAGTVTNGVYTTGTYADPAWITTLDWSKIVNEPAFLTSESDPKVGTLTSNSIPKWGTTSLVDGIMNDNGTKVTVAGDLSVNGKQTNTYTSGAVKSNGIYSKTYGTATTTQTWGTVVEAYGHGTGFSTPSVEAVLGVAKWDANSTGGAGDQIVGVVGVAEAQPTGFTGNVTAIGVVGQSNSINALPNVGVYSFASASTSANYGVIGIANAATMPATTITSAGLVAYNSVSTANSVGLYAAGGDYAGYFEGKVNVVGNITANNLSGTNTGDVTIGTANGLSLVGQALSLTTASASTTGALTSADWTKFNNDYAIQTVNADYLASTSDGTILVDCNGANRTITLPAASTMTGRKLIIKKIDNNPLLTVTVDANGSETIDGSLTLTFSVLWTTFVIQSNGSNWYIVN